MSSTASARPHSQPSIEQLDRPGSVRINVQGAFIVEEAEEEDTSRHGNARTRDIRLPHHNAEVSHIAVDIGGSLAKLVYFTRDHEGGKLNFKSFETEKIDELIAYMGGLINGARHEPEQSLSPSPSIQDEADHEDGISSNAQAPEEGEGKGKGKGKSQEEAEGKRRPYVMATGGGAYKFSDKIRSALGVELYPEEEMECLIVGLDFFITEIPEEVFTYSEEDPMQFVAARPDIYPYLLVNIGSGVSMVKVSGPRQFQRIGGSSLGGGTLWGLLSMLTPAKSFDEMLALAERGDHSNVDMMIGDIYGGDYAAIGLKSTAIASSFGKVFKKQQQEGATFRPEDISRSLLMAVSNNIGQLAHSHAKEHNLEHVYFGGSYIRGHRQTMNTLTRGLKFWSGGKRRAYFLRHEGYLGAVGAFLRQQPQNWGRRSTSA